MKIAMPNWLVRLSTKQESRTNLLRSQTISLLSAPHEAKIVSFFGLQPIWNTSSLEKKAKGKHVTEVSNILLELFSAIFNYFLIQNGPFSNLTQTQPWRYSKNTCINVISNFARSKDITTYRKTYLKWMRWICWQKFPFQDWYLYSNNYWSLFLRI